MFEIRKYNVEYKYNSKEGSGESEMMVYITKNEIDKIQKEEDVKENEGIKKAVQRFVDDWSTEGSLDELRNIEEKEVIEL